MAILVKQWLVQYSWTNGRFVPPPRLAVGLRQLHFTSLNSPFIEGSMAYAPFLLIIALFLFFAGLAILLWTLNSIVAGITTALIGFTTMYFLATTIGPSFDSNSMCRSIQAWSFRRVVLLFRFIVTGGRKPSIDTWIDISLEYLKGKNEHLSRALLWVHNHAVAWDFLAYGPYGNVLEALMTQQRHRCFVTSTWTTLRNPGSPFCPRLTRTSGEPG